ncbi:MAG: glycosyltransferase family 2 protein [Nanoarchaeota archaeon]|nr:glycosyltransferase family 2 protein [Nanoarchaeota archaeon]
MIKNIPKISVVMPVYNEAQIIEKSITSYYNELKGKVNFEMIIAEDGSTDGTKKILRKLKKKLKIRVYLHDKRKGVLRAFKEALRYPKYNWILLVDSDYQFDPKNFWKLLPYTRDYDIILGLKVRRKDPFHRIILSKGFNFLLRFFLKVPLKDMDTGFKLIHKSVLKKVLKDVNVLNYFTSELIIRSYYEGFKIIEVPVSHWKRQGGSSNVFPMIRIPKAILEELIALYKFNKELKSKY